MTSLCRLAGKSGRTALGGRFSGDAATDRSLTYDNSVILESHAGGAASLGPVIFSATGLLSIVNSARKFMDVKKRVLDTCSRE
jgi:hypothetical protein